MKATTQHANSFRDGCLISTDLNLYLHFDVVSVHFNLVHVRVNLILATICVMGVGVEQVSWL